MYLLNQNAAGNVIDLSSSISNKYLAANQIKYLLKLGKNGKSKCKGVQIVPTVTLSSEPSLLMFLGDLFPGNRWVRWCIESFLLLLHFLNTYFYILTFSSISPPRRKWDKQPHNPISCIWLTVKHLCLKAQCVRLPLLPPHPPPLQL